MKKSLLIVFALGASFFVNGQTIKADYPAYAVDDFSTTTEVTSATDPNLGIFFWNDSINPSVAYDSTKVPLTGLLSHTKSRLGDGVLSFNIKQPYNLFFPLGFGFGKHKSINLGASNTTFSMKITSKSDSTLYIRVAMQDSLLNNADSYGPNYATKGDWYKDEIGFVIYPGNSPAYNGNASAAVKKAVKFSKSGDTITVTIDFSGAYQANYGTGVASFAFDSTIVSNVQITVLNNNQNSDDGSYDRYGLKNVDIALFKVQVGSTATPLGVDDEQLFNAKGFVAYPNPTKGGTVHFNVNAENVKVIDFQGKVVFSAANASEVNTESFAKGIYLVQTSKGSTRFVVE